MRILYNKILKLVINFLSANLQIMERDLNEFYLSKDRSGDELKLFKAIRNGNDKLALKILSGDISSIDFKAMDDKGITFLEHALDKNCNNLLGPLIINGADVKQNTKHEESLLFIAVNNLNKDAVLILLDNGATISKESLDKLSKASLNKLTKSESERRSFSKIVSLIQEFKATPVPIEHQGGDAFMSEAFEKLNVTEKNLHPRQDPQGDQAPAKRQKNTEGEAEYSPRGSEGKTSSLSDEVSPSSVGVGKRGRSENDANDASQLQLQPSSNKRQA